MLIWVEHEEKFYNPDNRFMIIMVGVHLPLTTSSCLASSSSRSDGFQPRHLKSSPRSLAAILFLPPFSNIRNALRSSALQNIYCQAHEPRHEVIKLELNLRLRIKCNDWLLADTCPHAANHCALFRVWDCILYLLHRRRAKAQTSMQIRTVSPEPSMLACKKQW